MNRSEVIQENWILRKQVRLLKARLTLARAERDAARVAVINFNYTAALKEIEERYGLRDKEKNK